MKLSLKLLQELITEEVNKSNTAAVKTHIEKSIVELSRALKLMERESREERLLKNSLQLLVQLRDSIRQQKLRIET